jgi:hypothetical protein
MKKRKQINRHIHERLKSALYDRHVPDVNYYLWNTLVGELIGAGHRYAVMEHRLIGVLKYEAA